MNPVTAALVKELNNPSWSAFVEDWDQLNDLIIEIFKQKSVSFEQQELFFALQERLRLRYPLLAAQLEPFWRIAKIKGEVISSDPFQALIGKPSAREFVENWEAMRTLPAAREALNEMLMARVEKKKRET
jgi:hypothetical protein